MRRNNIRKTEALIMAFALSASLLLTSCGNQNTNGDSVNENNSTIDEAGVNHDYPVMLFSYDKNTKLKEYKDVKLIRMILIMKNQKRLIQNILAAIMVRLRR